MRFRFETDFFFCERASSTLGILSFISIPLKVDFAQRIRAKVGEEFSARRQPGPFKIFILGILHCKSYSSITDGNYCSYDIRILREKPNGHSDNRFETFLTWSPQDD